MSTVKLDGFLLLLIYDYYYYYYYYFPPLIEEAGVARWQEMPAVYIKKQAREDRTNGRMTGQQAAGPFILQLSAGDGRSNGKTSAQESRNKSWQRQDSPDQQRRNLRLLFIIQPQWGLFFFCLSLPFFASSCFFFSFSSVLLILCGCCCCCWSQPGARK